MKKLAVAALKTALAIAVGWWLGASIGTAIRQLLNLLT